MSTDRFILYVEDDSRSRTVVKIMISKRMTSTQLVIFDDSTNFMEKVEALNRPPDLVLLDIHVKPHNGFEMLAMLRGVERFRKIPVAALTASVMNEEIALLRNAGFDGCLAKPINMESFLQHVERLIAGEHVWAII